MKLRDADQVKVGDVFINCLRFNMLRVRAISGDDVRYLSWRPDGTRISQVGRMKLASLTKLPYIKAQTVTVYAAGQRFGFGLTPETGQAPK
jgi:hypothetical protein